MINYAQGSILSEIAVNVSKIAGPGSGDAFLYAEADDGWVASSVFKELQDQVAYRRIPEDPDIDIWEDILDVWHAAPSDQKWKALIMTVSGEKFDARFQYSEGWDENEDELDRRHRMVKAKFGDKPITYPTGSI